MVTIAKLDESLYSVNQIEQVYNILIEGYAMTESEIWGINYVRILYADFLELVRKGELLVAEFDGVIAGCIHYYKNDDNTYTFSLLASDFNLSGKGIGTALIQKVETIAQVNGAKGVKMEVLRVRGVDVPSKIRLHQFYLKLGYSYTHSADCICKIPAEKYKNLIAPSDFDFYSKSF
ncbi:hypothetical protein DNU06_07295 [Putridiphycobacter roseus]|uniref:N-acetyltransferase domain-containing protein n=1 Tax=Putridiphycobacter roseus TaxID=2219161 RepID=A0A2W1NI69_9FLAO|nr:GNAT family N-acetyltransferase [Putridiphycobacter roseus]PZE17626.1 hypothetical protein DNU06_07295 [Putridiphycobacter roseus]